MSEPVTPEDQYKQQVQQELHRLAQREGVWKKKGLRKFFEESAPNLYNLWHLPEVATESLLRGRVRSELLTLRDQVERNEEAPDEWLRPSKVPDFNRAYDATFNLSIERNDVNLEARQDKVGLKDSRGRGFKRAVVSQLADIIIATHDIPLYEAPPVGSPEPENGNDSHQSRLAESTTDLTEEDEQPAIPETRTTKQISISFPRWLPVAVFALILAAAIATLIYFLTRPEGGGANTQSGGTDQDLIFDSLGAGFNTILVYPGTSESDADKRQNAIYTNGETKRATCKKEGRMAHTNTAKGEPDRSSNHWFKIVGIPGQNEYARAIYTKNADELWAKLPYCSQ